jgi:Ca2+-binding RTX toxin-like protein
MRSFTSYTRRCLVAAATGFAAIAIAVPSGSAATAECGFDASLRRMHILLPYGETSVLRRGDDGVLLVDDVGCPGATVNTVDSIVAGVRGTSSTTATTLVIDLEGGPLAPGFTDEPGNSDEIELERAPHEITGVGRLAGYGRLIVRGTSADERMTAGQMYANLDATETDGIDGDAVLPQFVELEGRGGDDVLGSAGGDGTGPYSNDVELDGGVGADRLTGGTAQDTLIGGDGDDVADGGGGSDRLVGGAGDDALTGGKGDGDEDSFDGGEGADVITGELTRESGEELIYRDDPAGVSVDLTTGVATDGHGDVDGFTGAFGVTGSAHDDRLVARAEGGSSLAGGAGDDTLVGGAGDDRLGGGEGDDALEGAGGDDHLIGYWGDDALTGGPGDDELFGGRNDDTYDGGPGRDHVSFAEESRDVTADLVTDRAQLEDGVVESIAGAEDLTRGWGESVFVGDAGSNRLVGHTVRGGAGDDDLDAMLYDFSDSPSGIVVGEGTMLTDGWGGRDVLRSTYGIRGTAFADRVEDAGDYGFTSFEGGAGDDVYTGSNELSDIRGGPGADTLTGGSRHDVIDGGPGPDRIDFGPSSVRTSPGNTLTFADSASGVVVDLEAGTAVELGGVDTFTAPTKMFGSPHDDVVLGSDGADVVDAGAGDDSVDGREGDDLITAGPGEDDWTGGGGHDVLSYKDAGAGVEVDLATATASKDGTGSADGIAGVEEVHGTDYGDKLTGDARDNVLLGRGARLGGGEQIAGGAGDDVLDAGTRHSGISATYEGGPGDDVFRATWSTTNLVYRRAAGGIDLDVAKGTAQDGDGGVDTFPADGHYRVLGSAHDDRAVGGVYSFSGFAGDDVAIGDERMSWLDGGPGDDRLEGRGGPDRLSGHGGSDVLLGGDGDDDIDADDLRDGDPEGAADDVGCGAGADSARADTVDTVDVDCESVSRPPPPPPPPGDPDDDTGDSGTGTTDPDAGADPGDDTTGHDDGAHGDDKTTDGGSSDDEPAAGAQTRPEERGPITGVATPPPVVWTAPPTALAPRTAHPSRDAPPAGSVRRRGNRLELRASEAVTARVTVRRCIARRCTTAGTFTRRLPAGRSLVTIPKTLRVRGLAVVVRLVDTAGHAATIRSA